MSTRSEQCHANTKNFFARIKGWFYKAFAVTEKWIDDHVVPILHFIEGVKAFIDNPLLQTTLESLIPGVTPATFTAVDRVFDEVIAGLQIEIDCKDSPDLLTKIKCVAEHLATLHPELKNALLARMAQWLTRLTAGDHQFTTSELDTIVQFAYAEWKHDALTPPAQAA